MTLEAFELDHLIEIIEDDNLTLKNKMDDNDSVIRLAFNNIILRKLKRERLYV